MKRILVVLLAGLMSLSLFAGCADRGKNGGETVDPEDINVNIDPNTKAELEIMVPGGNINERTMIQCLIDSFADLYPNVTFNMSYVSVDNYVSAVGQQQLAGTLPDIVWSNSPDFYDLVESETFIDLAPYMKANEMADTVYTYRDANGQPSKFSSEDFFTEFFDMGAMDGKNYVVPRSCGNPCTDIRLAG